jgi:hypothetical protein
MAQLKGQATEKLRYSVINERSGSFQGSRHSGLETRYEIK